MQSSEKQLRTAVWAAAIVLAGGALAGCGERSSSTEKGTPDAKTAIAEREVPVVLTPVASRTFENRLAVQGSVEAKNTVVVSVRIPGTIDDIYVEEGDEVIAGETKLFQTDALKLTKAVEVSRQDVAVAHCAKREAEANLEMVQAQYDKAKIDFDRFQRLYNQNAVTQDVFEQQDSRYKQTKAGLKHAETVVDLATERARQAEAALAIAEKNLSDSLVYAPITGKVSARLKEPGESADSSHPVLQLVDPKVLEVSAFLPAQYYAQIQPGTTTMRIRVGGIEAGERPITYRSPTITPQLRTFEVKCLLEDPPEGVAPGALADIQITLEQRQGAGCPSNAVLQRGDQKVVFVVENNRAKQIPVETGLESDGWIELLAGAPPEGAPGVTMGQSLLNDGTPVTIHKEAA